MYKFIFTILWSGAQYQVSETSYTYQDAQKAIKARYPGCTFFGWKKEKP